MKKILLIIIFIFGFIDTLWSMILSKMERYAVYSNNYTAITVMHCAFQSLPYATGGLTFTYPNDFFTNVPVISVTIQSITSHSSSRYSAVVIDNNAMSTTIFVNVETPSGINEAVTGEVIIHLCAYGEHD